MGHGREPLFDYATAGLMALLGQHGWVLRGTAVLFSLLMIAGMAAWTHLAFNKRVALLTAAGLAVGFWPVMAGRQGSALYHAAGAVCVVPLFFLAWPVQRLETGDWQTAY